MTLFENKCKKDKKNRYIRETYTPLSLKHCLDNNILLDDIVNKKVQNKDYTIAELIIVIRFGSYNLIRNNKCLDFD